MLKRAENILDSRCSDVSGGTFHGFANITLRRFAHELDYQDNFTILDMSDAQSIISLLRKESGLGKGDKRFPKKKTLADIFSKSINTNRSINSILEKDYPQFFEFANDIIRLAGIYKTYKHTLSVMDYDDLLVNLLLLLQIKPEVRAKLHKQFQYIMIDEYQDTNHIQSEIIKQLTNEKQNIMVVGDDSQSIYSFRGADFKNIMEFPSLFTNTKIITLEQNYRSQQPILDLTNALIAKARSKYTKQLFTENEGTTKPVYIETDSENTQSRFICQKILELREDGVELDKIVVLMRSGWHSNDLEIELQSANLPFTKVGGFKFVESSHVKDLVSYLKAIYNPSDTLSWNRILVLIEGIGAKGATKITEQLKYIQQNPSATLLPTHQQKAYYKEVTTLIKFILNPENETKLPTKLLEEALILYKPLFKVHYDDHTKRNSDLDSLLTIAERFSNLEKFLTELSLDPPTGSQVDSEAEDSEDEKLTLSTIHSAKGLEWHTVFLISAVDGFLPSFQSLGDLKQIEEERRLMYVALTRAENNLFIIKPNLSLSGGQYYAYSGMQFSKLSRFLEEGNLIGEYAEKWALAEEEEISQVFEDDFEQTAAEGDENGDGRKYCF